MFPSRSVSSVVAPIVAFVLVLGAGIAFREPLASWWHQRQPAPTVSIDMNDLPEDAIERALRLASVDSTRKNEWVEAVPGIEASALSAVHREIFIRQANAQRCSCGCGFTLAACRAFDPSCEVSLPIVQALFDSVSQGLIRPSAGLRERPAGLR